MQIVINFDSKDPSYREAFNKYLEKMKRTGYLFEYGRPVFGQSKDWFNRIHEIDDSRVCARATDIKVTDECAIFTIEPFGPMASVFEETKISCTIGTRMVTHSETNHKIKHIVGLDMVQKSSLSESIAMVIK